MERVYKLGNTAYFSESAYHLNSDYATWYWGENAPRLEAIKRNIDPNNVFGCRHCIGYFESSPELSQESNY